jgi:D-sedoheptulose 7-phosphate isomerase
MNLTRQISGEILESIETKKKLLNEASQIGEAATAVLERLKMGGKLIAFGNGGSAADAQHVVAELIGRYRIDRRPFPAIALSTNCSSLTAIGNDDGFEDILARQVEALAAPGDVVLAISTSGNSPNVLRAIEAAKRAESFTIGLAGKNGGEMRRLVHLCLCVPSDSTPRIQEAHILIGHIICGIVEDALTSDAILDHLTHAVDHSER